MSDDALHRFRRKPFPEPPLHTDDPRVERDGPYWNLAEIQTALWRGGLDWILTRRARQDFHHDLRFTDETMDAFLQTLRPEHCLRRHSQWCVEPQTASHRLAPGDEDRRRQRLADAYLMAFNRITGRAVPGGHPGIYLKFTVAEAGLLIYSLHHERV